MKAYHNAQPRLHHYDIMTWKHYRHCWLLWGESAGHRWIPLSKGKWCGTFMVSCKWPEQTDALLVIWDAMTLMLRRCNITGESKLDVSLSRTGIDSAVDIWYTTLGVTWGLCIQGQCVDSPPVRYISVVTLEHTEIRYYYHIDCWFSSGKDSL